MIKRTITPLAIVNKLVLPSGLGSDRNRLQPAVRIGAARAEFKPIAAQMKILPLKIIVN